MAEIVDRREVVARQPPTQGSRRKPRRSPPMAACRCAPTPSSFLLLLLVVTAFGDVAVDPVDLVDARMKHSPWAPLLPYCSFSTYAPQTNDGHDSSSLPPSAAGLRNITEILHDLLPQLQRNTLSADSFGATSSVKWRFSAAPGSLEAAMPAATARWARPLVDAWRADLAAWLPPRERERWGGADTFLLNGLKVPCGAEVAGHYDDTVVPDHTPVRVSVLYLSVPSSWSSPSPSSSSSAAAAAANSSGSSPFFRGGELRVYKSRAAALQSRGSAVREEGGGGGGGGEKDGLACSVVPAVGNIAHFRGDSFHGISPLACGGDGGGGYRVSLVLEQYDFSHRTLAISVLVDGAPQTLDFTDSHDKGKADGSGRGGHEHARVHLEASATEFARRHGLGQQQGGDGDGCDEGCVVEMLVERMQESVAARRAAVASTATAAAVVDVASSSSSSSSSVSSSPAASPTSAPLGDDDAKRAKAHAAASRGVDFASDLADLKVRPRTKGGGVFARHAIDEGWIICEVRGSYEADDEGDDTGLRSAIGGTSRGAKDLRLVTPMHGVLRATGVCSQIRDSSRETAAAAAAKPDVDGGGSGGGGASDSAASTRANAHLIHEERSGKMLLQATEHIVEGAEIVCDWGERRIRNTAPSAADYSADTSAASAAAATTLPLDDGANYASDDVIDDDDDADYPSDLVDLEVRPSQLLNFVTSGESTTDTPPSQGSSNSSSSNGTHGAMLGVFARRDLASGSIVCEMRGRYVCGLGTHAAGDGSHSDGSGGDEDEDENEDEDAIDGESGSVVSRLTGRRRRRLRRRCVVSSGESWDRTVASGRHGVLVESGVCSLVNDCRAVAASPSSTAGDGECWSGLDNNVALRSEAGGKHFLTAERDIKAGEELYYPYGDAYWDHWLWRGAGLET